MILITSVLVLSLFGFTIANPSETSGLLIRDRTSSLLSRELATFRPHTISRRDRIKKIPSQQAQGSPRMSPVKSTPTKTPGKPPLYPSAKRAARLAESKKAEQARAQRMQAIDQYQKENPMTLHKPSKVPPYRSQVIPSPGQMIPVQ